MITASRRRLVIVLVAAAVVVALGIFAALHRLGTDHPTGLKATSSRHQVELHLGDRRTGVMEAQLDIRTADGRAASPGQVTLEAAMPSMGHATSEVTATRVAEGRYQVRGELFPMTGAWDLTVRLTDATGPDELTLAVTVTR